MAFLFNKFQEAVKVLAKSPTFARDGRHLQFEADMNKLFLLTSYNRLGSNADEADADEIIDLATKASLVEQQKQVQENVHAQINTFCSHMDDILLPSPNRGDEAANTSSNGGMAPRKSGLGFAVGKNPLHNNPGASIVETKPLTRLELSQKLKDLVGYTLEIKPSQIQHKDAGQGLFIDGEANAGSVIAIYPGVAYSPAYYRYIPGYPRVDLQNPYLITRYDGTIINAKPWGYGGNTREMWDGLSSSEPASNTKHSESGSDRVWRLLSKPLDGAKVARGRSEVIERRNPFAFAHFANHPGKDMAPNVIVCPYDFRLTEKDMRTYIPNISFGSDDVRMRKFGSFWFKSWKSRVAAATDVPILKSLVLIATREIRDEEVMLNYRLSNLKQRPSWYTPVDEEEDRRRWS